MSLRIARISAATLLAGAVLAFVSNANAANVLTNGSFESFTGTANFNVTNGGTQITGWTALTGNSGLYIGLFQTGSYNVGSEDGSYYLDLTGTADQTSGIDDTNGNSTFGGIDQTFSTISGDTYDVSYYLGNSDQYNSPTDLPGIDAYITGSAPTSLATLLATTPTYFSNAPYATATTAWTQETFSFVATGASTTLTLEGYETGSGLQYVGLDNVVVSDLGNLNGPPGVPDSASSLAMLAFGLGCLAVFRKLQNQSA